MHIKKIDKLKMNLKSKNKKLEGAIFYNFL